jgi:hypothetical protein
MPDVDVPPAGVSATKGLNRYSLKFLFILFAIVAVFLAGATWFARSLHYGIVEGPLDCYATMYAAGTVRTYLMRNNGRWPKGWEDLRPIYEERYKLGENAITFDEMKARLEIDFNVDPYELSKHKSTRDTPPFKVFRLRNGRDSHWEGAEPNTLILQYLKAQFPDG